MKKNLMLFLLALIVIFVVSCTEDKVIKIGFVSSLTGVNPYNEIPLKNGVELAVEEINAAGGIQGKKLELVIKDNQWDSEVMQTACNEFAAEGVLAVIGPATSYMAAELIKNENNQDLFFLSPTVSSQKLVEENPSLFSLTVENDDAQRILADYIYHHDNVEELSVIYDVKNPEHIKMWAEAFVEQYEKLNGVIVNMIELDLSGNDTDLFFEIQFGLSKEVSAVLIVTPTIYTSEIAQQLSKIDPDIKKYTHSWTLEDFLIENAGTSVEGIIIPALWDKHSKNESFLQFREKYSKRYSEEILFASQCGYEAVMILKEGIEQTEDLTPANLKEKIIKIGTFEGLAGDLTFDKSGSVYRDIIFYTVEDGQFKKLQLE